MDSYLPPVTNPAPSPQASSAEEPPETWQLRLLREMAQTGGELVQELREPDPARDAAVTALAFSRLTRAVRQILALHGEFERDGLESLMQAQARRDAQAAERAERFSQRRDHIIEALDLASKDRPASDAENLFDDIVFALRALGDEAIATRPVFSIVQQLCTELNLPFDPRLWDVEDWAHEECQAQTPGSPYAIPRREWPKHWPITADPAATPDTS
jgi:hypothetical protein